MQKALVSHKKTVIVVGGGLAGLSCAMRLAELGIHVKLVSITKVKRSHSVCAQGGINAALNQKNEGDSPLIHAYETLKGGDFLADQPPVVEMCLAAPKIIRMMDRLGCPFNRTAEGNIDVRRFGGSLFHRTVFCGASTGQQLLYTLDEQVRRYEVAGLVEKYENHEFMRLCLDENKRACGIVMMDHFNMKLEVLKADAVVVATGGLGVIFKKSTNSTFCTGAANGRLYLQGMKYANGEFIQIHPTAIVGEDKMRLMSESSRGEGGRLWVPGHSGKEYVSQDGRRVAAGKSGKPWYFLEELYPAYGNLVPRDIASREIMRICEQGLGVDGEEQVYLDVSHLPKERLKKLQAILEIYEKFTGMDPAKVPMKIHPAVHYSMGGAWVDWPAAEDKDRLTRYRQMTNLKGCFNVGESDYLYHGANRLGANSLLSCIFGGLVAAGEVDRFIDHNPREEVPLGVYSEALEVEEIKRSQVLGQKGSENVYKLYDELAEWMVKYVTVTRSNPDLDRTIVKLKELRERQKNIAISDDGRIANQSYIATRQLEPMLEIALVIAMCARVRDESRGSHAKQEWPNRNDEEWLKTTCATYNPKTHDPDITFQPVDIRYVKPVLRDYKKQEKAHPHFENLPEEIPLPL